MTDIPIKIQFVKSLSNLKPSRMIAVKADGDTTFTLYVTDKNSLPYPLKDLTGSGGITNVSNTDGNLVITGINNKVINISPALLATINSALQSSDLPEQVTGETPLGALNGINAIFTTLNNLVTNSEEVYVNGNRQKKIDDYNISGQTITFTFSPQSTETILIDYIKL